MRSLFRVAATLLLASLAGAQPAPENYRAFDEHPRLLLRPLKLRLLRRERERNSLRWEQFQAVVTGGGPLAEPAFAQALYFSIAGDKPMGARAIASALRPETSIREAALVYDWCYAQLSASDKAALLRRLTGAAGNRTPAQTMEGLRSQAFAAIALAGDADTESEAALRFVVETEWTARIVPGLMRGRATLHGDDNYALYELLHAVRDNLNRDLRAPALAFFTGLPFFDLLSYYPLPWPAPENEFHIPFTPGIGEPDLHKAALSRAAELAMVAFDTNSPASQFLQGWLTDDRFLMRGAFGIPYEFLWANPYQPGLSYDHVPLAIHDELFGRFAARSSWKDDARWAAFIDGTMQQFRDGEVTVLDAHRANPAIDLDTTLVEFAATSDRFRSGDHAAGVFLAGLTPGARYHVEIDDEEMFELEPDGAGTAYIQDVRAQTAVRFKKHTE